MQQYTELQFGSAQVVKQASKQCALLNTKLIVVKQCICMHTDA
jgi:hypothetical protein